MFKLWHFGGGVHLDTHKTESTGRPLRDAGLPEHLILPLQQRGTSTAKPVVAPGERALRGQVLALDENPLNPPIHASTSGIVKAIEDLPLPHPSGLPGPCLVVAVDGEDEGLAQEPMEDFRDLPAEELRRRIHEAGIVGLGGAAFPTAVKVAPGAGRRVDTLVLNGAECEPYITCDDSLMRHFPQDVLGGAEILLHILGAERCLLGIEDDMPEAIAALEAAKASGGHERIDIVPVPAVYPTGGEKQLIKVLTGREVPAGGIPADVGIVCQNVGTAAAIHRALVHGEPLTSRIVTVTGPGVRQPQNLMVRIGTPIAHLIAQCGGYTEQAQRLILGGPMMGLALPSDELPIIKAANCVLVAGTELVTGEKQALPCIRCGECAKACPVNLLPQQLYWYSRADNLDRAVEHHLSDCIECGCCDFVCPSHIPLVQYFRAAKAQVMARQRERDKAAHAKTRFEFREQRKEREKLEKAESARRKRELLERVQNDAPKSGTVPSPHEATAQEQT